MNPFEVERLGWDEIRGLPVVPDPRSAPAGSGSSARASSTAGGSRRSRPSGRSWRPSRRLAPRAGSNLVPEIEPEAGQPALRFDVQLEELAGPDQDAHGDQDHAAGATIAW